MWSGWERSETRVKRIWFGAALLGALLVLGIFVWGIVLKNNANLMYCTDGVSASVFRKVCGKAGVKTQTYYNRADIPGGSTLGRISLGKVSILTADIGLPQLAMHSCYETAAVADLLALEDAMAVYYGSSLEATENGFKVL